MGDLHQRLLDATSPLIVAEERTPEELAAALRAVVELHTPVEQEFTASRWLDCRGCDSRGEPADWPCSTIQAIARELGIEAGDDCG